MVDRQVVSRFSFREAPPTKWYGTSRYPIPENSLRCGYTMASEQGILEQTTIAVSSQVAGTSNLSNRQGC